MPEYPVNFRFRGTPRDECPHGSLRRSCEVCERDERIAELEKECERAKYDRDVEKTVNRQLVELCRKLADGNDDAEEQLAGIIGMDGRWD
jgi:hypothetical protein